MKIKLTSIFVDNQEKALKFYTEKLGFVKKTDQDFSGNRWLTVIPEGGNSETELLLEPNVLPVAKTYQESLFKQGIPITAFASDDIVSEVKKIKNNGVEFSVELTEMDNVKYAIFNDTCGNLIQIYQEI